MSTRVLILLALALIQEATLAQETQRRGLIYFIFEQMWGGWFRCWQDTDSHICDQRFNHSGGDACLGTLTCFSSEGSASKDKCITVFPKNERASGSIRQDNFWEVEA